MSTIQINSQHRGNLDLADIQNIKTNAKEGDTVTADEILGVIEKGAAAAAKPAKLSQYGCTASCRT